MRVSPSALWLMAALQLCACQIMSGLSELQAKPEGSAQMTEPVTGERMVTTDAKPTLSVDAGMDAGTLPSGDIGNDDTPEEKESAPAEKQMRATMDAGLVERDEPAPGNAGDRGGPTNVGSMAGAAGSAETPSEPESAGTGGSPAVMEMSGAGAGGGMAQAPDEPVCKYPTAAVRCSVTEQCGCDDDENCAVDDAQILCMAAGSSSENQYCREPGDCATGYQCAGNACLKLCDPSKPECSDGAACVQLFWDTEPVPGVFMCASACNPLDPQRADGELNACGSGLLCSWWDNGTFCSASERATRRHGEFCRDQYDCASGYACATSSTCAKWCLSNSDCPSGFSCALDAPVSIGQKAFGMCKPDCIDRNERICGLTTQCGCDNNHSCDTRLNEGDDVVHECRPVGPVGLHQTCRYTYDCGRGAQCVGSECQPVCLTDLDCPRYGTCELSYFDEAPFTPAGSSCRRPCDPADPYNAHGQYGRCSSGSACEITSDGVSFCRSADLRGTAGAHCDGNSDCAVGYTCTSDNYCVGVCRGTSDCLSGTCHAFATAQFAADVEWGYCANP